jgi:2-polyprenyl-3-methyl-5-hydroxy-6-metoxy-1,4-benzoquinol methylase
MSANSAHFRYIRKEQRKEIIVKIKNKEELIQAIQCVLDFLREPVAVQEAPDKKSLLMSDEWPEAVPAFLICNESEEDKLERADGIIDVIQVVDLSGKKILDFGCGEGHLVKMLGKAGHNVIGYDIKKQGILEWNDSENPCVAGEITTNWQKISSQGPFDFVVLYDVIDHCEDPVAALNAVHGVCHEKTSVFLRTHPFCGPHGGHIYRQINKAYVHLFFNEEELKEMGANSDFVRKVFFPLAEVEDWLKKSSFKIISNSMTRAAVPSFFKKPEMIRLLLEIYPSKEFPEWQMSQVFNDYVLQKS